MIAQYDIDFLPKYKIDFLVANSPNIKYKCIVLLMSDAGLRVSEVLKIQLHDFDFKERVLQVESLKKREKAAKAADKRLFTAYEKLRSNVRNGLAVVNIKRHACGGCFHTVPPQRQADVASKKKIIVCESCGRIFVDVEAVAIVEKPKRRTVRKKTTPKKEATEE